MLATRSTTAMWMPLKTFSRSGMSVSQEESSRLQVGEDVNIPWQRELPKGFKILCLGSCLVGFIKHGPWAAWSLFRNRISNCHLPCEEYTATHGSSCTRVSGNSVAMASGKPLRPSTQAINISWTPRGIQPSTTYWVALILRPLKSWTGLALTLNGNLLICPLESSIGVLKT